MCRLGHKKSRKGCTQCKQRRVKCDEQTPCRNCTRRGENCSLLAPSPSNASEKESGPAKSEEWLQDLGLMRHFVKATTHDLVSPRQEIQRLWQEIITDEALKYPLFVYLYAYRKPLSALHLAHIHADETEYYLQLCDNHQTKAVEMFRSILSMDLNAEMSSPMFALASCISISSMARPCAVAQTMPEPRYVDIDQVAELFLLTRGVRDVVEVSRQWIEEGPLGGLLNHHDLPNPETALPESVVARLHYLDKMIDETCTNEEHLRASKEALKYLDEIFKSIVFWDTRNELQTGHVWSWMTHVPNEFVQMIRERIPQALVLLADFAAASLSIESASAWYTSNWGHYCLEGITMALHEWDSLTWLEAIDWSKAQASNNMAILRPSMTIR